MHQTSAVQDTMIEPPNYAFGWYAPLVANEVNDKKILGFNFMGKPLIAYRNQTGKVIIMDGVCPHFGADLSKGDICDGQVRCYFHGFYFNEHGQCTKGDLVEDPTKLARIKIEPYVAEECCGQIWIWHGPNSSEPDIPLPIKDMDWDDWSTPVTSRQREVINSNMCYLTENIIDLQHFAVVHQWELHEVVEGPKIEKDGTFIADIKVGNNPFAQRKSKLLKKLTRFLTTHSRIRTVVYSPGCAIATINPGFEYDESKVGRSVVVIYPRDQKTVSIRVAVCFKKQPLGEGFIKGNALLSQLKHWFFATLISKIAVKDFDGDLKVWNNRQYLSNPKIVKEDGPMLLFRKWYLRFWHADYRHELINPESTGKKIPTLRSSQL